MNGAAGVRESERALQQLCPHVFARDLIVVDGFFRIRPCATDSTEADRENVKFQRNTLTPERVTELVFTIHRTC
jgi:hypothetical protein